MTIYDTLDSIDVNFDADDIKNEINDVKSEISSLDDQIRSLTQDVVTFADNLNDSSFSEIADFLEDLKTKLEEFSDKLY